MPDVHPSARVQAIREVACPKCGALPLGRCMTPAFRFTEIHSKRLVAYCIYIGDAEWNRRHAKVVTT